MKTVGGHELRAAGHLMLALPFLAAICLLLSAALPHLLERGGEEIARLETDVRAWVVGAAGTR
jgi:hypothetical protein